MYHGFHKNTKQQPLTEENEVAHKNRELLSFPNTSQQTIPQEPV